jgi:hypothetical protein
MLRKILILAVVVTLATVFSLGAQPAAPAQAYATVTNLQKTCSYLFAEGTSNAPYVILWADYFDGTTWITTWEAFPVSGGNYVGHLTFPEASPGTLVYFQVWGSPIPDPAGWDFGTWYYNPMNCVPFVPGPGYPSGFMQYNILCDTEVYDEAGGSPIPDTLIKAGQDWHIDPTPVTGANGQLWHEIFVGGNQNGFIPAACVGTPTEFN